MYRSTVSPLSVWLLCATSFFIFCKSSLQQDTLYLVMELASASRPPILRGLPAAGLIVRTVCGTAASSFGGKRQSGRTFSCGPKSRIIVAANTETATNSMKLWIFKEIWRSNPQKRLICGHLSRTAEI